MGTLLWFPKVLFLLRQQSPVTTFILYNYLFYIYSNYSGSFFSSAISKDPRIRISSLVLHYSLVEVVLEVAGVAVAAVVADVAFHADFAVSADHTVVIAFLKEQQRNPRHKRS